MPSNHELSAFMDQVAIEMASEYERIRSRAREDPGTAGDEGEENWRSLFQDWLPSPLPIVTKGRILGLSGSASPQMDVIVLDPSYPKKLLNKKVYLSSGVLAAFECKLTLRPHHLTKSASTAQALRHIALEEWRGTHTPYSDLHSSILYGLLAHDADLGADPYARLDQIVGGSQKLYDHPADLIDVICVSALGSWERALTLFFPPPMMAETIWGDISKKFKVPPGGGVHSQYSRWEYYGATPLGGALRSMIAFAWERLAFRIPEFRDLARYWSRWDVEKVGGAINSRMWPASVLSDEVRRRLGEAAAITHGDRWSEWRMGF